MYIVGKILKPQGIKGEVKIEVITSFPEHFNSLKDLFIKKGEYKSLHIESVRLEKSFAFIKFSEIQSRNEAETFRGFYLYIPEDGLQPLNEDEYYHHQLNGMQVFSEDNVYIGKITAVESYPQNDVLVVKNIYGISHLIPMVKDIVRRVDIKSQKVTIHIIEGLLG
jgi:16S rRNA processing protein RimM